MLIALLLIAAVAVGILVFKKKNPNITLEQETQELLAKADAEAKTLDTDAKADVAKIETDVKTDATKAEAVVVTELKKV